MPRKRTGYDAACYYDGKLLGRCTKADSDAYTPVSYTHLDVYKRQALKLFLLGAITRAFKPGS